MFKEISVATWLTIAVLCSSIIATNAVSHYRLAAAEKRIEKLENLWELREERVKEFFREYDIKETEDQIAIEHLEGFKDEFEKLKLIVECLRFTTNKERRNCN